MTSKERIRAALQRKPTDRVPSTMQCVDSIWEKLREHFHVNSNDEVQDILEIDTRILDMPPYIGPKIEPYKNKNGDMVYTNNMGCEYINKWNGVEYNSHIITKPYSIIKTWEDFESFDGWINPDNYDYNAVTDFVKKHSDKAIRIGWPGPYQVFTLLYDAEEFYINMIEEPELIKAMLNRYCDSCYEIYERMYEAANGQVDFIHLCDDYGTQRSTLFSPAMWDEFFAANTKRFVAQAHRHNCFYMQHSCGAIRPIIPNLIRCGIDAIEPIQKVTGLEVDGLKTDFGEQLCFQGGIDTQDILPFGTPEDVYEETTRVIHALYGSGKSGYILCGSQDFEGDVPVENILALYEARKQFGGF
ncbi:MAG: methyltransferase [Lachnospiraceae bacterium]|jgi:uroporphyrinogen decarboxylase|nr:methyltransferase [Lachnospiraceae bacterium]